MLSPGERVDDYEIIGLIGDGGMGAVYEATQLSLNRPVALKVIDQRLTSDEAFRARFRREGEIQAQLDHPNIVPVYQAGEAPEGLFIAMRIIRGTTLKELVRAERISDSDTVELLGPIADALDTAHDDGLIHRDVKPQNILVDEKRRPFLADFGLTKRATSAGLTRTGQFVGTFDYVSPEQVLGQEATAASDVYSLAAVVFECLSGVPPFVRPNDAALLYAHVNEDPPDLKDYRPELPDAAALACLRGLAKEPTERYETASALVEAVTEALSGSDGRPSTSPDRELEARREQETDASPAKAEPPQDTAADAPSTPQGRGTTSADAPSTPEGRGITSADSEPAAISAAPARVAESVPGATKPPPAGSQAAGAATPVVRRRQGLALVATAAVLGLAGATAGLLVSGSAGSGPDRGPTTAVSEPASISPAGTWQAIGGATAVEGLDAGLRNPAGLRQVGAQPVTIALGEATGGANRSLLSPSLSQALPKEGRSPSTVGLEGGPALRYTTRSLGSDRQQAVIFALPTSSSVMNMVCRGAAGDTTSASALTSTCSRAANTLGIQKPAEWEPVGPDPGYADSLNEITSKLNGRVAQGSRALGAARTSGAQARAADSLAQSYGTAAAGVRRLDAPQRARQADVALGSSLEGLRNAYLDLQRAAARESSSAYRRAQGQVTAAQRRLQASYDELRLLGYRPRS